MTNLMQAVGALLIAYLAGSLPVGLAIAKLVKGVDIRKHGSGNIGATNVGRVIGTKWGLVVLICDALKGMLPTLLLPMAFEFSSTTHEQSFCAIAAIVGHMFPVWLAFRGGKGVATGLGVVLVISPLATAAAFVTFAVVFWSRRIVSLASILAAVIYFVAEMILLWPAPFSSDDWSRALFAIAIPGLIIFRHRSNIFRLLSGQEETFSTPAKPIADGSAEPPERPTQPESASSSDPDTTQSE